MNFDHIKKLLSEANSDQLNRISRGADVPVPTLIKIKYGQSRNPRVLTIEKLARYFTLERAA